MNEPPRPTRESMLLRESVGMVQMVCAGYHQAATDCVKTGDYSGGVRGPLGSPPGDHFRKANILGNPELYAIIRRAIDVIRGAKGPCERWDVADRAAKACPADELEKKASLDAEREEAAVAARAYLEGTMQPILHECLQAAMAVR